MDNPDTMTAYFAGLFDGEGSVGIYAGSNGSKVQSGAKTYWSAKLAIVGTHRPMIESAYKHFGVGQLSTQKRQALGKTPSGSFDTRLCKQAWRWMVTRRGEVSFVLTRIVPYLIEKRIQADAVLAFLDGVMEAEDAAKACREAKQFSFPADHGEPARRSKGSSAEQNPLAKLSWAQAEEIRKAAAGGESQVDIVRRLGISKSMVSRIVSGQTYNRKPAVEYANA